MKYSKMFGKTEKNDPKDVSLKSHKYLLKGGFIKESVAGRYFFLPLGMRVRKKLIGIIREEMDNIGGQEMITPTLHPLELWEETNRTEAANFELMTIEDRRGAKFALGGTAEEMMLDVVRKHQISYRDLPIQIYQFSQKFRDEMRARGGLLRAREFLMKDAYSFHTDKEDFDKEYQNQWDAYSKIFDRVGLKTDVVASDGGYIGGDSAHEFIVESEVGESKYLVSEDGKYSAHQEIAVFTLEDVNAEDKLEEMQIVDQPEWVKTMEDNLKHYKKPLESFLKNVVYRTFQGDLIIVTMRGDMSANSVKLKNLLDLDAEPFEAEEEDLVAIGTKTGYVHSWGHKFLKSRKSVDGTRDCEVIYVADDSLKTVKNFIGGQKEETTDSINVNYGRDFKHEYEGDVALAQSGYLAENGSKLVEKKGVEVGNIFQLGYHYSERMANAVFTSKAGKPEKFYMGSYGIGIGRTMATVAEIHSDDNGIIWPMSIAPYQVHLVTLGEDGEGLYRELTDAGIEVLWDEREKASAGEKFADADLIGIPIRLVLSKRSLAAGGVEMKMRKDKDSLADAIKIKHVVGEVKQRLDTP